MNHNQEISIQKDFVPYEEALSLKELGFNEPCFGYYENNVLIFQHNSKQEYVLLLNCSAPIFSQAFKWFREKKLLGLVNPIDDWNNWSFSILAEDCMSPFFEMEHGDEYKSYEEAELACLIKLIEIVKGI